jgi:hypothetical protein
MEGWEGRVEACALHLELVSYLNSLGTLTYYFMCYFLENIKRVTWVVGDGSLGVLHIFLYYF